MKPGVYTDLSNEDYHATAAVSKSTLDMFATDPHRLAWAKSCPQDEDKLRTFDFGDAMHAICLEPDRLKSEFIVRPAFNMRTNAGKEDAAAFEAENTDKKILTADDYTKLCLMYESVIAHPQSRDLIEADGLCESSWFWKDPQTGIDCKCRPDKAILDRGVLVDVKTTDSLSKFCYSVDDYRYYVQDPWYCDGVGRMGHAVDMLFLVVQKTIEIGRYPVMVVRLPAEAIELGREEYRRNLNDYAQFIENGSGGDIRELPMHWRFMERAMETITEIQL